MNRRRIRTLTAWLLPWICLRALLPSGFMPQVTEAGWQIVICDAGSHHAAVKQHHDSQHHDAHHHDAHHHGTHNQDGTTDGSANNGSPGNEPSRGGSCLFALSAGSAPIPFVAQMDFGFTEQAIFRFAHEQQVSRPLVRAQQPRAPPFYS